MGMILINSVKGAPISQLNNSIEKSDKNDVLKCARIAAEAHRINRHNLQNKIKPGISLREICDIVENNTRLLLKGEVNDGLGFPTGVSINSCAAHYTVNPGDEDIFLKKDDVIKIDFGTHVNGYIMDSAFTVTFDPKYENLLLASKESTEKGIKSLGVDVRVCDIGRDINEVMSSYEITLDDKLLGIKPVFNLNGHSIKQYNIHAGISIPLYDNQDKTRIKEGLYALETFATTGAGYVNNGDNCSHFMMKDRKSFLKNKERKLIYETIQDKIKKLPFSPRFVSKHLKDTKNLNTYIRNLASFKLIEPYPPLYDSPGSFVSQFEHTCYVTENNCEVLTRGDDY